MTQQRCYRRIPLTAKISLIHREVGYEGRLENASLNGTLVSFSDRLPLMEGDRCTLLIYPDTEETPLRLTADVMHICFTMVGMQFVSMDDETRQALRRVIERACEESGRLTSELDDIRDQVADYLRPA